MKWVLILFFIYISYRTYRIATIDNGLGKKVENDAVILDVRTATEYNMGHIDGSINISLAAIRKRYVEVDPNKVYITCYSHSLRSVKVKSILNENGFKHINNGGAWSDLEQLVNKFRHMGL
ncbi:phage shock protein E [Pedobacter sp. UYEF25]